MIVTHPTFSPAGGLCFALFDDGGHIRHGWESCEQNPDSYVVMAQTTGWIRYSDAEGPTAELIQTLVTEFDRIVREDLTVRVIRSMVDRIWDLVPDSSPSAKSRVDRSRTDVLRDLQQLMAQLQIGQMTPDVLSDVLRIVGQAYQEGIVTGANQIWDSLVDSGLARGNLKLAYGLRNPDTLRALEANTAQLGRDLTAGTRSIVSRLIYSGVTQGKRVYGGRDSIAGAIFQACSQVISKRRAQSIALFEVNKVQSEAHRQQYQTAGLTKKSWVSVTGLACPICAANDRMGFIPIDGTFRNVFGPCQGPPGHPTICHCRLRFDPGELWDNAHNAGSIDLFDGTGPARVNLLPQELRPQTPRFRWRGPPLPPTVQANPPDWIRDLQSRMRWTSDGVTSNDQAIQLGKAIWSEIDWRMAQEGKTRQRVDLDQEARDVIDARDRFLRTRTALDRQMWLEAISKLDQHQRDYHAAFVSKAKEVLKELRSFGRDDPSWSLAWDAGGNPIARAVIDKTLDIFPTEWLDTCRSFDSLLKYSWQADMDSRGYFQSGHVMQRGMGKIVISGRTDPDRIRAATHELGHLMEFVRQKTPTHKTLYELEQEFYDKRTKGEKLVNAPGYGSDEWFRPDRWGHIYVGKDYGSATLAKEVFSTGVESVLGEFGSCNAAVLDLEHIAWTLGILGGLRRA